MAKKILLSIVVLLSLFYLISGAHAAYQSAALLNSSNSTQDVFFSTAGNGYKDDVGNTPDVKVRVCADTAAEVNASKKVAVFYLVGADDSGLILSDILGGDSIARFISLGTPFADGGLQCSEADFEFFAGRSPYPSYVFAVVDTNGNNTGETFDFGVDEIIAIPFTNGSLKGTYTTNDVQASYVQGTGDVDIDVTAVTVNTDSSTTQALPSSLNDENKLLVGVCTDSQGESCSDTARTNVTAGAVTLDTGVVSPADSSTTNLFAVINGIGTEFCIGPDLTVTSLNLDPDSAFQSEGSVLNATVRNNNNVDVTTNFDVEFLRDGISINNETITEDLSPGESTNAAFTYDTTGLLSGDKTITARILDSNADIADCDDGNDNETATLTIKKTYQVLVLINGIETTVFPVPGRPYNVTLHVNDSDGNDAQVLARITERNGINLFAPLQNLSAGKGVAALATAEFETDGTGDADLALIPTGNKLYEPEFAYLNVSSFVGDYNLYLELFNSSTNEELQLYNGTDLIDQLNFTLTDLTTALPTTAEENSIFVFNHNSFVQQVIDLANQVYSSIVKWTGVI